MHLLCTEGRLLANQEVDLQLRAEQIKIYGVSLGLGLQLQMQNLPLV